MRQGNHLIANETVKIAREHSLQTNLEGCRTTACAVRMVSANRKAMVLVSVLCQLAHSQRELCFALEGEAAEAGADFLVCSSWRHFQDSVRVRSACTVGALCVTGDGRALRLRPAFSRVSLGTSMAPSCANKWPTRHERCRCAPAEAPRHLSREGSVCARRSGVGGAERQSSVEFVGSCREAQQSTQPRAASFPAARLSQGLRGQSPSSRNLPRGAIAHLAICVGGGCSSSSSPPTAPVISLAAAAAIAASAAASCCCWASVR